MKQLSFIKLSAVSLFLMCFTLLSCGPKYENVYFEDWDDLAALPEDTGGEHLAFTGKEYPDAGNGFYIYLPAGWETTPIDYPTIIFYHGAGEDGNSNWIQDNLDKVLKNGPPRMIESGEWDPPVPFIVISLQSISSRHYWASFPDAFWQNLFEDYPIDTSRAYNAGLSMGGIQVLGIRRDLGNKFLSAAGVCISSTIWDYDVNPKDYQKNIPGFPLWEFHGENDMLTDAGEIKKAVSEINENNKSFPVKLTIFPELNHSCWEEVFTITDGYSD